MGSNKIQIKKAVFPAAGMGTCFLPVTRANPGKQPLEILLTDTASTGGVQAANCLIVVRNPMLEGNETS